MKTIVNEKIKNSGTNGGKTKVVVLNVVVDLRVNIL